MVFQLAIRPVMLAAVNEREGGDRNTCGMFCSVVEDIGLAGDTIGIGQMRVDLANRLVCERWGIQESKRTTRRRLAVSNHDGIALAGAYLKDLQSRYGLSSREAAIAYAFGEGQIGELRRTNWQGPQAAGLGRGYDERYESIAATGVFH